MLYYIKPHNEYVCSISVDSDFDFGSGWSLMDETATHFYMNTDNIDKAYAVAKALGVSITTVNTAWEIDPCLLEYDGYYLDTLSWTVEYWDNLPVEMIDAIIATGDTYGFDLYTKAYAYMRNGITVYNNSDIDWDAPAPELPDDVETLSPEEDMMITLSLQLAGAEMDAECEADAVIIKFSEFYALSIYYHVLKNTTADVWANGNEHEEYASEYTKVLLSHYGYDDDEYLTDTTLEKDFSKVVGQLVHDPYDLWVIAHMTSKVVKEYHAHCQEYLWTSHKSDILNGWAKYVPVPSGSSQYVIAYIEVVEPTLVHHDVKLDDVELPVIEPVEVIVIPQEVVEEPQEDCLSTTTEDNVMNTNTLIPNWEVSGYVSLLDLDFGTYVPVVEVEPIVELTGQASDFACHISDGWTGQCTELTCDVMNGQSSDILEGWVGKASHLTSHISDGWFGQCCLLTERPLSTEEIKSVEHKVEQFANGKKAHVKSYKRELRPNDEIATLARIKELVEQSQVPTITTKSGKVVQVSPHCIAPHGNAPIANRITSPKVTSAIGEAEAVVTEFKSTLFNLNDYDITHNIVVDVATTTPKSTPKAPATPKPSTAKFANNFNSLVMAKYRELNNGIIKDSLVLNKLTSALRANNSEAYANLVTTFNNPTAVALHRQAYDALITAS